MPGAPVDRYVDASAFDELGAVRFPAAVRAEMPAIENALAAWPCGRAGIRIGKAAALNDLLNRSGTIGRLAAQLLGDEPRAVRAILFDKTPDANWSLAWHQDRTICPAERIDTPGFGPWTIKDGLLHVAPPFSVLAGMVTLRIHLDPVDPDNAPLLIAPGSHREGRVEIGRIDAVVERRGIYACLADRGDVWAYATPILHASDASVRPVRRRVLQVDYAARNLPGRLRWAGL